MERTCYVYRYRYILSINQRCEQPDYRIGDPILHIELRRWADVVLIAPCSANTLAKIANGICDNLAVTVYPLFYGLLTQPPSSHSIHGSDFPSSCPVTLSTNLHIPGYEYSDV